MSRRSTYRALATGSFRKAQFWAILGAIVTFSISDSNPVYLILVLGGVCISWLTSVKPNKPVSRLVINTILMLVIAIAGVEMLRSGVGVAAFAVFVALLLVVKLLDLRSSRDDGQVLVLCLSILVAAVLTSNSLMTGCMMVLECILLLRAFLLFQIHSVVSMGSTRNARISKPARIDIRSMMIASGFLCALIGSVVFIVLPRNIGTQAFGQWGSTRSVSGFSPDVELGRAGFISTSTKPVLDLTVTDRNARNVGSENGSPIYLRGSVLELYDGGNWRRSVVTRVPLSERIMHYQPYTTLRNRGSQRNETWDRQYEITMRGVSDGPVYLFAPWRTVELRIGSESMRIGYDFNRGIFLKDGIGGSFSYDVRSVNEAYSDVQIADDVVRSSTVPTSIDPAIAELAREVLTEVGAEPDPAVRPIAMDASVVRVLEMHLRTHYQYTLDAQPVPNGEDATSWFLFERQMGHCEYYASALTLMCRSVGIPARVVTGYIASDFNPVTEQYVVRESNAHAWVEAEIAPGEWRTFDGTPPSDFHDIHVPDPSLWRSISRVYESVEFMWGRAVIGYDSDTRRKLMGDTPSDFGLAKWGDRVISRIAAGRAELVTRAGLVALIVFTGSMFVGLAILRYQSIFAVVVQSWRALLERIGMGFRQRVQPNQQLHRLETAIRIALRRTGLPKPDWMPLRSHLEEHQVELEKYPRLNLALHEATDLTRMFFQLMRTRVHE